MNILLWILQILVAFFCAMGATWTMINYDQAAKGIASLQALPAGAWDGIGALEIVFSIGLVLPGFLKGKKKFIPIAAACLAVVMFCVTVLHVHYFGFQYQATNPGAWSFTLAVVASFIAYGRAKLKPL